MPAWAKAEIQPFETGAQVNTVTSVNTRTEAIAGLAEQSDLVAHTTNTSNPHGVTKAQVGLGNVPDVNATDRTNHTGVQDIATVDGLQDVLDGKQSAGDYATNTALADGLEAKASDADVVKLTGNQTIAGGKTFSSAIITQSGTSIGGVLYLTGTGMPNGVVSAPVGSKYIDTAVANGAQEWMKRTGVGNTGWEVTVGDTGWRSLYSLLSPEFTATFPGITWVRTRRSAGSVEWSLNEIAPSSGTVTMSGFVPIGMRPYHKRIITSFMGAPLRTAIEIGADASFMFTAYSNGYVTTWCAYTTTDPWPTSLPGTPA